jgi:hypothetical protein
MAPTITRIIPINIMKNEIPIAKKLAVSNTTTKTEKISKKTLVKLVIFVFAALGCFDKDNPAMCSGVELVPLLLGISSRYNSRRITPDRCLRHVSD